MWRELANELLDEAYEDLLTEWELGFMQSFADGPRDSPTERQEAIFKKVVREVGTSTVKDMLRRAREI